MTRSPRPSFGLRFLPAALLAVGAAACTSAPPPAPLPPPLPELTAAPVDWSAYAGQRVQVTAPLTLVDTGGEGVLVRFGGRAWNPTERARPGSAEARAQAAANRAQQLRLVASDDTAGALESARLGSTVGNVDGVISVGPEGPLLRTEVRPTLQAAPRPVAPVVAGNVRVAAFNLENLFNGDGRGGGFPTPRGARTPAEHAAQLAKLVATVQALDADVAALMELENDGDDTDSAQAQLVQALNAQGGDWRVVATAGRVPGFAAALDPEDPIKVGLIYRGSRLQPVGRAASLLGGPFPARSRPSLAQAFRAGRGPVFVVVANHFKSKGCSEAEGADRDQGDGQACWNATRTESARRLAAWLERDPTGTGSQRAVILGDLNSYAQEDPVHLLTQAGWQDAFAVAGVETPYSYAYRGTLGRLDHALLSPALAADLRGAAEWHANADEPRNAGYRDGGPGPWRSSDHDPLLLGFDLRR
ncbi:ExeM/NucH family extracellular endonuclease [Aerolutibacter daejeonensis]|uniref:ExeM/NucH family extracellular endonuclease n=1 Tax=Aerolutibacter daejeonensis TaxID=346181 RepID=UPI000A01EA4C|nr:ExeM/NucH family extracellular endonuclease [Lysobacter daejeonensis]